MRFGASPPPATRALGWGLLWVLLIASAVVIRYRPPPPVPADAPATEFSALRAFRTLAAVIGEGVPHPIGSAAHDGVRDRILGQLRGLGLTPEVQAGYACEHGIECGAVENILARFDGRRHDGALLLAAHYDSVPAGPGAADDGAGVAAVLETVRALRAGPPLAHDVIVLISDGEEAGLLGARVFAARHPWAAEVCAAINLEARGSRGPSFMFETGSDNRALMARYGREVPRPITNSIYDTAYKLLPNDTDFTVFKSRGWQGYNFAWIGHVHNYHTPHDDLAHLSLASLQHQGDNALSTARALADQPWPSAVARDSVYVDLFALGLLQWPAAAAPALAVALSLLGVAALAWLWLRGAFRLPAICTGLIALAVAAAAAAVLDAGLIEALRAHGALPPAVARYDWTARALPIELATALLALLGVLIAAQLAGRRAGFWGSWAALLGVDLAATVYCAWRLPGLSFAPALPALAALLGAVPLLVRGDPGRHRGAAAVPMLVAALLVVFPTLIFVYALLGVRSLPLVAGLGAWTLAPLIGLAADSGRSARWALLAVVALGAAASGVWAVRQPAYSQQSPQRLNLAYRLDADGSRAVWLAQPDSGRLPSALAKAAAFGAPAAAPFPWSGSRTFVAPAPPVVLPPPALDLMAAETQGGDTRFQVRLRSLRGATAASLCFAPGVRPGGLTLGAVAVSPPALPAAAARCLKLQSLPAAGQPIAFTVPGTRVELDVADRSPGLPAVGDRLRDARPADAVPAQDGDETLVVQHVVLQAPPPAPPAPPLPASAPAVLPPGPAAGPPAQRLK